MEALLHDIGMAKLPKEILDKPAGLTVEEFVLMQRHVPRGLEVLEQSGGRPAAALEIIDQHHERHDGSGYGGNRKADLIGYWGAIGAIVDVYDAILVELNTAAVGVVMTINRARRLKSKVALLLTANKEPLSRKFVVDLANYKDSRGKELKIDRVLPPGSYDVNPMDHSVQL